MTAKGSPVLLVALSMLLLLLGCVRGEINQRTSAQSPEPDTEAAATVTTTQTSYSTSMENWRKDCSKSYSSACLKLDVVSFVDRLSEQDDLGILPGVSVVRQNTTGASTTTDVVANLARDFPHDVDRRMDAYLMHKIGSYLNSHAISIKLFDPRTFEAARSFNEAALEQFGFGGDKQRYGSGVPSSGNPAETGRRKDKGGMNSLMAGLMMMKGTLGALGFGALAMLAGKALMTGLMALMLSAIVGLKSLASGGEKKTTYEIVSKPVYTSSHTHSSEDHHGGYGGGYGRSLDLGSSDPTAEQQQQEAAMRRAYGNVRDRRSVHQAL